MSTVLSLKWLKSKNNDLIIIQLFLMHLFNVLYDEDMKSDA